VSITGDLSMRLCFGIIFDIIFEIIVDVIEKNTAWDHGIITAHLAM